MYLYTRDKPEIRFISFLFPHFSVKLPLKNLLGLLILKYYPLKNMDVIFGVNITLFVSFLSHFSPLARGIIGVYGNSSFSERIQL